MSLHVCEGCGRKLEPMEPHIHVKMDEFAAHKGLALLGMDDLLPAFVFCETCTEKTERAPWRLESHA